MAFYRAATLEDFEKEQAQFDWLPASVKKMLADNRTVIPPVIREVREKCGLSLPEAKALCRRYYAYQKAWNDYRNGIVVYTEY
jgi:ribosomal protein L7/L12